MRLPKFFASLGLSPLLRHHLCQVVPGLGILWAQFHSLFQISPRRFEVPLREVQGSEVVMRLWILGLRRNHCLKRGSRRVEIPSLIKRDPVGEIISLEICQISGALRRESETRKLSRGFRQ